MATDKKRTRRYHGAQLKAQVVAECAAPGKPVAQVAMAHGINANVVCGWRQLVRQLSGAPKPYGFVPVVLTAPRPPHEPIAAPKTGQAIEVELHRGTLSMKINWPQTTSADLAAWAPELLR
jgi:transposase